MKTIVLPLALLFTLTMLSTAALSDEPYLNQQTEPSKQSYLWTYDQAVPGPGPGRGSNRVDSNLAMMGSGFWSGVGDAQVVGNLAYCSFANGLVILDVSDPLNPTQFSMTPLSGQGKDISVDGSYAYIASGTAGLHVLDISEPAVPLLVATLPMEGNAVRLSLQDSLAVVATIAKFYIVSISVPSYPQVVAAVDAEYGATSLDLDENLLYVADGWLKVFDISVPTAPVLMNDPLVSAVEVLVVDTIAYASYGSVKPLENYMSVVNVADPTSLQFMTTTYVGHDIQSFVPFGDFLIVPFGHGGIRIFDVSDPPTILTAGWVRVDDALSCCTFADTLLLITSEFDGVHVADISLLDSTEVVSTYEVMGSIQRHDVVDKTAFMVCSPNLFVVDVARPKDMTIIAEYVASGWISDVVISGNLAFAVDCYDGLLVLDISDQTSPLLMGQTALIGCITRIMKLDGNMLYLRVNNGVTDLAIVNISDPLNPIVHSQTAFPHGFDGLDVKGNLLYLAGGSIGLVIVDATDPVAPVVINEHLVDGHSLYLDVAVDGNLAYLVVDTGLVVLDVTDPMNPIFVSEYLTNERWSSVSLSQSTAYCVTHEGIHDGGIEVVDIGDPANPLSAGYLATPARPFQMIVQGRMIYVADLYSLLVLADTRGIDCCDVRADLDHSGSVDVADLTYLVAYLFQSGPAPPCLYEGDVDGSGGIDVGDLTWLVSYLFQGGPDPVACP